MVFNMENIKALEQKITELKDKISKIFAGSMIPEQSVIHLSHKLAALNEEYKRLKSHINS